MPFFALVSQSVRPTLVSVSKRTAVRTYFATSPTASFSTEDVKHEDKVHHQMAPLTDSTVYSPQGTSETSTTVFSPIVNTVFDE
ncbi:hypothetical protein K501DRAFT_97354 [Backusella circina FSU 941]|nr:hypothetical protein K501DRAFT_97354 [Backusella circina FSU 941]